MMGYAFELYHALVDVFASDTASVARYGGLNYGEVDVVWPQAGFPGHVTLRVVGDDGEEKIVEGYSLADLPGQSVRPHSAVPR